MLRCLWIGALSLSACASAPRPITMSCRPLGDVHVEGAPLSARVELRNESSDEVAVLGMNVPWNYRHAMSFEAGRFADPRAVADPGEYEDLPLGPGEADRGDFDVTDRLVDASGRSITAAPGTHHVEGRAHLALDAGTPSERTVDASCAFDVTIEPRISPIGRAYEAAAEAARAGGYEVSEYRAVSAREDSGGWTFDFVHTYPAPPGGHFSVHVARDGATELRHGE